MDWFTFICYALLAGYVLLILIYLIGWLLIPEFVTSKEIKEGNYRYTILVPARNEEDVIRKCLKDLSEQHYPSEMMEVIVIDDHSTDTTAQAVEEFVAASHRTFRLLSMQDDPALRKQKKAAITHGIEEASFEYIILTDADCERGNNWLSTIDRFMKVNQSKMIYAPVEFKANTLFEKIQSLEFAGLVGIGASAIRLKNPNMCSAANLIFEKHVFEDVEGYKGYDGIASGDDEFLMHKVFKRFPDKVHFLKHLDAIVKTSANTSLEQLTDQRRRWVSKSTKYENRYITLILVGAYVFNACIVIGFFVDVQTALIMMAIKTLTEGIFLFSVMKFFRKKSYLLVLPLAEFFHILYVLIIGIWANTGTYHWKGRNVK